MVLKAWTFVEPSSRLELTALWYLWAPNVLWINCEHPPYYLSAYLFAFPSKLARTFILLELSSPPFHFLKMMDLEGTRLELGALQTTFAPSTEDSVHRLRSWCCFIIALNFISEDWENRAQNAGLLVFDAFLRNFQRNSEEIPSYRQRWKLFELLVFWHYWTSFHYEPHFPCSQPNQIVPSLFQHQLTTKSLALSGIATWVLIWNLQCF